MAVNTPLEIVESYVGLLIMQYLNKPKASGFISAIVSPAILPQTSTQTIAFSAAPTSGAFVLSYDNVSTPSIAWNASVSTIEGYLQGISGLGSVTVSGSIAGLLLTVTFTGVTPPALALEVVTNSLLASAVAVDLTIAETDQTLPLAVQDAFNLISGSTIAAGVQLDTLGKYVGAFRTAQGFTTTITLDDADFYQLIQMAIIKNSAGSSLATIQAFLHQFFPNEVFVYDHKDMTMTYVISQAIGSQDLIQVFVTEGFLPSPMAVGVKTLYPPSANLFSFRTYDQALVNGKPFNTYQSYNTTWPWLDYHDLITV